MFNYAGGTGGGGDVADNHDHNDARLGTGEIVGAVFGAVFGVVAVTGIVVAVVVIIRKTLNNEGKYLSI